MVVRYTNCSPHTADLVGAFSEYLEYPHFVRVGDGQAFAGITVTVFFHQFTHQADGVAGCRTTLQDDLFQFFDHEHTVLVYQLFPSGNRGFTDTQLLFVQTRVRGIQELIGGACLGNIPFQFHICQVIRIFGVHPSVVDGNGCVAVVGGCRDDFHPGAVVSVTGVARHDRTVRRRFFADHNTCTALRCIDRPGIFYFLRSGDETVADKCKNKDKQSVHVFVI